MGRKTNQQKEIENALEVERYKNEALQAKIDELETKEKKKVKEKKVLGEDNNSLLSDEEFQSRLLEITNREILRMRDAYTEYFDLKNCPFVFYFKVKTNAVIDRFYKAFITYIKNKGLMVDKLLPSDIKFTARKIRILTDRSPTEKCKGLESQKVTYNTGVRND